MGGLDGQILPPGIKKNLTALVMFAALVTGGVEMRMKVQDVHDHGVALAQELKAHENDGKMHDGSALALQQAVQQANVEELKRRLGKLEEGQEKTQDAISEVLREVQSMRREDSIR